MPLPRNLRRIKVKSGQTVFGYVCRYRGMDPREFYGQVRRVRAICCDYIVFDHARPGRRIMAGGRMREVPRRHGLSLLMRGLMHGDIVVVDSLGALSVETPGMYDALGMLRSNEIRVLDMDPDGLLEWRAPLHRALASMCRIGLAIASGGTKHKRHKNRGVTYHGIGWFGKFGCLERFEKAEGPRTVARTIERLHDEGMSFKDIAKRLKESGVLYQGCVMNQCYEFTATLAEECYLSAKQGFPPPTVITQE